MLHKLVNNNNIDNIPYCIFHIAYQFLQNSFIDFCQTFESVFNLWFQPMSKHTSIMNVG